MTSYRTAQYQLLPPLRILDTPHICPGTSIGLLVAWAPLLLSGAKIDGEVVVGRWPHGRRLIVPRLAP